MYMYKVSGQSGSGARYIVFGYQKGNALGQLLFI